MKIDHDTVKEKYLSAGFNYRQSCGKALADISGQLLSWKGPVICIFGPPGCGKSRFISRLAESPDTLIIETSGINLGINRILLRMSNVEYLYIATSPHECIQNLMNRAPRPLDAANSLNNLVSLVKKFFDLYDSDWGWKLPMERRISWQE